MTVVARDRPVAPALPRGAALVEEQAGARFLILVANAVAMGWLEAVVVVYIRGLVGIARHETIPAQAEVMQRIGSVPWLLATEQGRELATMVMLATVAMLAARRWLARLGAFLIVFPWLELYPTNWFVQARPEFTPLLTSYAFRGAMTGLGCLNVVVGLGEAFRLRRFAHQESQPQND
jgi:hypothetical protein